MKGALTWPSRSYFFIEVELSIIEIVRVTSLHGSKNNSACVFFWKKQFNKTTKKVQ